MGSPLRPQASFSNLWKLVNSGCGPDISAVVRRKSLNFSLTNSLAIFLSGAFLRKSSTSSWCCLFKASRQSSSVSRFVVNVCSLLRLLRIRFASYYPANEYIIGSGHNALLCRYQSEKRILSNTDQLSIEWAGTYKHYHSAMFRTITIGKSNPKHIKMYEACLEALQNCEKKLIPGNTAGEVFDVHAKTFDNHGYKKSRMNACGYSLGSTFSPNWMDWPMLYTGNPYKILPGNIFFLHMILMDSDTNLAMNLGETYLVTENGNERLGKQKLDLVTL